MKPAKSKFSIFLSKMRFRYRVSVMNENTLEESWFVRLSRFSVFLWFSLLVFVTFISLTLIITFTPLKYYLPGYIGDENRSHIINESMTVDSLLSQVNMQSAYLNMIREVISGSIKVDSVASLDSVALKKRAEVLMEKKRVEEEFIEAYEEEEKFNLASLSYKENENVFVFFRPVAGVISSGFDMEDKRYGTSIVTAGNESVASVLPGVVINTSFTFNNGWEMTIQHEDGYLSVYKFMTQVLKSQGNNVRAGEAIGFCGSKNQNKNAGNFYFELWRNGKAINPEEIIVF